MSENIPETRILKKKSDGGLIRFANSEDEFLVFEGKQDADIVATMRGNVAQHYVYQYEQGGDTIVDVTKDGIFAYANHKGGIEVKRTYDNLDDKDSDEFIMFYEAKDTHTGDTREGSAQQPKKMRNGNKDPFSVAKCTSKAQRNAIKNLINIDSIKELILIFLEDNENREKGMALLGVKENIDKFSYEESKVSEYCNSNFGESDIEELDSKQLARLNSYMVSRRGRDALKPNNDDLILEPSNTPTSESVTSDGEVVIEVQAESSNDTLEQLISKKSIDRKKLESFVKSKKEGRGLDDLSSEEYQKLVKYLTLSTESMLEKNKLLLV